MTKKELIRRVAKETGFTKADCAAILDSILQTTAAELSEGGELLLTGFGKLSVKDYPSRKGVHPRTGEEMEIPGGRSVVFKAGKPLQELIDSALPAHVSSDAPQ